MKVESMPDFYPPFDMAAHSSKETYWYIKQLENARSLWDSRIRVCQEREFIYKKMVNDMAALLMNTFREGHDTVSENAAKATEVLDAMRTCMRELEA